MNGDEDGLSIPWQGSVFCRVRRQLGPSLKALFDGPNGIWIIQVQGCHRDITGADYYFVKKRTCKPCTKLQSALIADELDLGPQRFCQQVVWKPIKALASMCVDRSFLPLLPPFCSAASSTPWVTLMAT